MVTQKEDQNGLLLLIAGQKYCRMLQGEHSAILSTFIKLPFFIKIFVLSIFAWLLKTGLTVLFICPGTVLDGDLYAWVKLLRMILN